MSDELSGLPPAQRVAVHRALGDSLRLAIVDALALSDLSPATIAAELGIAGNLLAHHLNILVDAGLVTRITSSADRRRTYLSLTSLGHQSAGVGQLERHPRRVVFVCTQNSARSILADALWRITSTLPSASAGTAPADRIHPRTVEAAARIGLQLSQAAPMHLAEVYKPTDIIVSVCDSAGEELDRLAEAHLHWSVADPVSSRSATAFDRAISELRERVARLSSAV